MASSSASPAADHDPSAAERLVDDPRSTLQQLAVGPRGARAALWQGCAGQRCHHSHFAVAISADGFATRSVLPLPTGREVRRTGSQGPLRAGELALMANGRVLAFEPDAAWHGVPVPRHFSDLQVAGDRLSGVVEPPGGRATYALSEDGGGSWRQVPLPVRPALWMAVGGRGEPAVIEGTDGATLFPFVASWRDSSARFTQASGPVDPTAYVTCAQRLRDGRLLVCVDAWSDQRGAKVRTPPGIWVSTDTTWTEFRGVPTGAPFDEPGLQPVVVGERATARGLLLMVTDPGTGRAWETRDLGRTFEEIAVR